MIQFSAARPGVWEPALSGWCGVGEDAKGCLPPFSPPGGSGLPNKIALEVRA